MSKEIVDRLMALADAYAKWSSKDVINCRTTDGIKTTDARAALRAELERLFSGEPVAWMKGMRICISIETKDAMLADGWSPLYAAPQSAADAQKSPAFVQMANRIAAEKLTLANTVLGSAAQKAADCGSTAAKEKM